MRHLIVAVAVVACLIVMSSVAQACSCGGGGTLCEAYGTASGQRFEPMEHSEKARVTLEEPQQILKIVITRIH